MILVLTSAGLSPARAGDEPPGIIGEPYFITPGVDLHPTCPHALDYTGCGGVNTAVTNADYEQQVLDLVNQYRADEGLPPLKRVTALDYAARYHSADLGQDDYFDHNSYNRNNGSLTYVCSWSSRVSTYYPYVSGENIAGGYWSPQSVMTGWMNSSGHRANILNSSNKTIGIGYYYTANSTYERYWTQDFGRPSGEYPMIINRDAASTDDRDVSIYIYGDFDQMRLKNDTDTWGSWQTFQNSFAWKLNGIAGERTVTAELKTGSTTYSSNDMIILTGDFTPTLGNLPDSFTFMYSIPEARLQPVNASLTPLDINTSNTITWTLSTTGVWFSVSPTSGVSPQSFQITPDNFNTHTANTYTGSITITVNAPSDIENSPHTIDIILIVIDSPFKQTFLPLSHN